MNTRTIFMSLLIVTACALRLSAAGPTMAANRAELTAAEQKIRGHQSGPSPGRVVVVYFTPRGKPPARNHTARIRRIVEETAGFYERELASHGFPDRTMSVLRDQNGEVQIIDVVGVDADYDKPDGKRIRDEVIPELRRRNIDAEQSVLLLFCNLMDYDPVASTISHHSPYYGGGSHLSGTAWQCDSEILDPERLTDTTPLRDGQYGNITVGRHNSIFIGGVIHELGHALSLPHCRQREDESAGGTALMGSGNQTYQQQLRNEGLGTFLTQTHALRLASHPVFCARVATSLYEVPKTQWTGLTIRSIDETAIHIAGSVTSTVPVHAVISYFDPAGGSDYDATTASGVPDDQGIFAIRSGKLRRGRSGQLRLLSVHVSGATSQRSFAYRVLDDGTVDLAAIRLSLELGTMIGALQQGETDRAQSALEQAAAGDRELMLIGQSVLARFLEAAPTDGSIGLTQLTPESAQVGWLRPTYDRVPETSSLMSIDGDFFRRGIYAHAPAVHQYSLDQDWKRLTGRCGVQSGHLGTVGFRIRGDGRLLWSVDRVTDGSGSAFDIDVGGVEILTLEVTDGGDGNAGDWGVWIQPRLFPAARQ